MVHQKCELKTDKLFCRNLFNNSKYKDFNPKFIKVTNDLDILNVLLESYPAIKPMDYVVEKESKFIK